MRPETRSASGMWRSLALLLVLPGSILGMQSVAAQVVAAPSTPTVTGAFFAVSVKNLEASRRWYESALGLRLVLQPPAHDGISVVILEGTGLIVELIHNPAAATGRPPVNDPARLQGLFKTGVMVEDFAGALALLRARGIPVVMGPFPARDGQRANLIIADPDGNLIQILGR